MARNMLCGALLLVLAAAAFAQSEDANSTAGGISASVSVPETIYNTPAGSPRRSIRRLPN